MKPQDSLFLCVKSCGATAGYLLASATAFKVLAVFKRSVYLQACLPVAADRCSTDHSFQPGILCLVDLSLGQGPLHCCVAGFTRFDWSDLKVATRLFNDRQSHALRLRKGVELNYRHAVTLGSESNIPAFTGLPGVLPDIFASGLHSLRPASAAVASGVSGGSLWAATQAWLAASRIIPGDSADCEPVTRLPACYFETHWCRLLGACGEDIGCLKTSTDHSNGFEGILAMLGTGPGLTPSGDDFIGGVVAAFYLSGDAGRLSQLHSVLTSTMLTRTHPVSAAHLYEVLGGRVSDSSLAVITALTASLLTQPPELMAGAGVIGKQTSAVTIAGACDAMGASSGWDFLAGLVAALYVGQMAARNDDMPFQTRFVGGVKKSGEVTRSVV